MPRKQKSPFHATEKRYIKETKFMLRGTTLLGAFAPTLRRAHTQLLCNGSTRPSLLVAFGLEARGGVSSVSHTVLHRPTALCDALRTLVPVIAFLIYILYYSTATHNCQVLVDKKFGFYTSHKRKVRVAHLSVCFDLLFFLLRGRRVAISAHCALFTATSAAALARASCTDTRNNDGNGNGSDHRHRQNRAEMMRKPGDHFTSSSPLSRFLTEA